MLPVLFVFFIDGNLFAVAKSLRNDFETLLNSREVTVGMELTEDLINKPEFIAVVAELLNVGYWVLLD